MIEVVGRKEEETHNITIDDLVEKIKSFPAYFLYEEQLEDDSDESKDFLKVMTMIFAMKDKDLQYALIKVSHDLLFGIIDQKLKTELKERREKEGIENEDD